jgi:hypothetical protein
VSVCTPTPSKTPVPPTPTYTPTHTPTPTSTPVNTATPSRTPTVLPTPLPIYVSANVYKKTSPNGGSSAQNFDAQVRIYDSNGNGIAGKSVTMVIEYIDENGQQHSNTISLGPTDANGYAQSCGARTYPLNAQLTVGTQPVANPPGGQSAPGLSTVTVQTSGQRFFC